MRKGVAICILLMLLSSSMAVLPCYGNDDTQTDERDGPRAIIFIHNITELQNICQNLNGSYELANDIDASASNLWNSGAGFIPVGNLTCSFNGTLDGKNCTITGLFVNRSGTDYNGLFGLIGTGGVVKDLGLINTTINGKQYVGSLVGMNYGAVNNTYAVGRVNGDTNVGGLVGLNANLLNYTHAIGDVSGIGFNIGGLVGDNGGTVNNSYAAGNMSGCNRCVGGLVGYNDKGTVNHSYAMENMTGTTVGGLVGENNQGMVNNSYALGNVNGTNNYVGGLVGYNRQGTVNNAHTMANVYGTCDYVGGLVGFMYYGTVTTSYASGNVTGIKEVGGLVGENRWGMLDNSYATGNVTATSRGVGGFVGYNNGGTVNNSHATGNVTGTIYDVGGLVGQDNQGSVNNSYAAGNVTGWTYVGGLVGYAGGTVDNSYAMGNVIGTYQVGGLIGINFATVTDSYFMGNVTGTKYVGGLAGISWATMANSHYNTNSVLINGAHHITTGALFDAQYRDWLSSGLSLNISDYSANLVPSGEYYSISSVQGLRDLLGFADVVKYKFRLGGDIDLSNASGLYIPHFIAQFDGHNYTISNLSINLPFAAFVGMFGYVEGGTIENTRVVVDSVTAPYAVGGLVGDIIYGTVSNSVAAGNVMGTEWSTGGLIGYSGWSTVSNSSAMVNVAGCDNVGGLVGSYEGGTMSDSYATGNVSGIDLNVGGLVGYNWGTVNRSYMLGNVTGIVRAGGLVGVNEGMVSNSYATGNVRGDSEIGGLVGLNIGIVNSSYAAAKVIGNTNINIGGLVGQNSSGTVSNCFWDNEISGQPSSNGGTGKTTAEMMTRSTFTDAGWNFTSVWCMIDAITFPFLRWQETEPPKANAGPDRTINEDVSLTFDGGSSSDNIGVANYTWTFMDVIPIIRYGIQIIYEFDNPGLFVVTLNVTDAAGNWDKDTINVTVNDITPPSADAGPDRIIDEGTLLIFNGNGSSDNVGIVNYTWTFTDRAPVTLYGCQPTYQFNHPGIFVVELNITDVAGNRRTDTMKVTVNDITEPIADAGPSLIVDEGTLVRFNGNRSSDNVGIVKYIWTFLDVTTVILSGVQPLYEFDNPGIFFVMLNVTDAAGNWDSDVINVTVNDITDPIANAGNDQIVNEGTSVSFDGIGSYDNAGVVNYTWDFIDGAPIVLYGARLTYKFDNPGVFLVTLNVTDAAGNRNTDTMSVTVNDITAPIADSGPNQTINEDTLWTFDASVSSDNVRIVKFTWTFFDTSPIIIYGVQPTYNFSNPGIFIVTLKVTDAAGNNGQDILSITVNDITPPVADAGHDQRVIVGSSVLLNGSLSIDNVGIGKYAWNFTYEGYSKGLEGKIVSFTFDKGGIYKVGLTVIDGAGNLDNDSVVISVVDTGRVTGTVLDGDKKPIEGATVKMTASNGMTCTTKTAANGTFLIEIYHGLFTWKISKEGYSEISGNSSVDAMDEDKLDLSDHPLKKQENGGPLILSLILVLVIVLVIAAVAGIGAYGKIKKRKSQTVPSSQSHVKLASEGKKTSPDGSIESPSEPAENQNKKGES
jgi:hypothetical protein